MAFLCVKMFFNMKSKNKTENSEIGFLKKIYSEDPLIADRRVLFLLRENFPNSSANLKTIYSWKCELRKLGISIPLKRVVK